MLTSKNWEPGFFWTWNYSIRCFDKMMFFLGTLCKMPPRTTNLLNLRRAAFLGALTALHYAALYRPGELLLVTMTDFISGRYTEQRAADHAIPPCQAITIRVRTKSDFMSRGSIRHLSPTTKSGLNIRLWSDRLIWIHFALQLPSKTPLFPKTKNLI